MQRWGWRGWGGDGCAHCPAPRAATMGCCCSSDYDDDWIENIDICEHCNYPIDPDSKRQVRGGGGERPKKPPRVAWGCGGGLH